jgi:protease-4
LLQLRESLDSFKRSGKFLYAYADSYSQSAYYLSSVADSVFLNPNGDVGLQGFGTVIPFFKKMLDKVGVDFNVFYAGDYKSATEPFRRENMSPENRLQTKEFLTDMLSVMKSEISESRKIDEPTLDAIMSDLKGRNAKLALENKLVDGLMYWDEFETIVRNKAKIDKGEKINYLSLDDYNFLAQLTEKGSYKNKIAVVYAEGEVAYNSPQKGNIDNKRYLKIFDKIKRDDKIKAVVLRVNSGGGSALTSDIIWREVENLKAKGIPVIASFGDYAASGGYYIAAGADTIVASPNTLTGSIGVFSMLPNFRKLMNDKLGIGFDSVRTHDLTLNLSTIYPLSEKEKQYVTESTNDIYAQFLDRVSKGRGMPVDSVHKYAQGRVWTGNKAKEIGLVDVIGFLKDAVNIAAKKAKLEPNYKVVEYPQIQKTMIEQIMENVIRQQNEEGEESTIIHMNPETRFFYKLYNKYKSILSQEGVQARLMWEFDFD